MRISGPEESPSKFNDPAGMAAHAFPLKSVGDAIALRFHVMEQLEKAEVCEDPELRRWYLSFVVIGGGFTGVETAGASMTWYGPARGPMATSAPRR